MSRDSQASGAAGPDAPGLSAAEKEILATIRSLKFGSVEVVVHESRVVRIERREKVRIGDQTP